MYRKRADKNQYQFAAAIRLRGYFWEDKHSCGLGVSDGIMCNLAKTHCEWVEIKSSARGKLTDKEREFFDICPGGPPILAWTPELAIAEFETRALAVKR